MIVVNPSDILNGPKPDALNTSIGVPKMTHSFSILTEFVRQWFFDKFEKDYFKTIHIEGKALMDDFRNYDLKSRQKRPCPAVSIIPQIDHDFDRDYHDLNPLIGGNKLAFTSLKDTSFFKDSEKNMYIGLGLGQLAVNYTIRIKVLSKMQQLDLYEYMKMKFANGFTSKYDIDLDFNIPYGMMMKVAQDAGFVVKDNKVVDSARFLSYLNMHSELPIRYKTRLISRRDEYFVKYYGMQVWMYHIDKIDVDEGQREGMLNTNFTIEMRFTAKIDQPKSFVYFSKSNAGAARYNGTDDGFYAYETIHLLDPLPLKNEKGWEQLFTSDYIEENLYNPVQIGFKPVFDDLGISKYIKIWTSGTIDPKRFIDIKILNDGKLMTYDINWTTMTITTKELLTNTKCYIAVYADMQYINELKSLDADNRIQQSIPIA